MKQHLRKILIAMGIFVAGCKSAPPPPPAVIGPVPANSFARKWSEDLELKGDRIWQLHLHDEGLFVYTDKHDCYQLSREGGQLLALTEVTSPGTRMEPPVVLPKMIIYPTSTTLEIYDKSGKKIRSLALDFAMRSPAIAAGDSLYVGGDFSGGNSRFVTIDLTKPYTFERWAFTTGGAISAAAAFYQNVLFVGSVNGRVYAITQDREPVWALEGNSFETAGKIMADVKADDFGVYVASTDSKLYCLDRLTGRIKWQYYAEHAMEDSPIVTPISVYQAVPHVGLVAIDKLTGEFNRKPKWIAPSVVQVLSEDSQNVYVRLEDNTLAALDNQTGNRKFISKRHDLTIFATNTKDATIFAATPAGKILAITPVLKPGTVNEIVLIERPLDSVALSN